ncbi:conserved Plasmodium protein, unknown function [Plasmodium chabaudi chabaudi]|uniref:Gamma tubulin complex component protein N-terminal domain-containing protein n=1 Tax=Plasmodium chabaudi chabaudi TaxID=31271 RepID=A0A4V0K331_PLACU|nr:conserved Plasmodium protein, unknown function [Plasmodium chabaudi chabaudi]VTZ67276.1 conserved Plasmodium protein, unknown function [Plasmodium chabaudi chabaudi]|eukprot:XP_742044.2 conserved Plasmodium protein, unknown function [Plasmodium chabaudi chabaudi]
MINMHMQVIQNEKNNNIEEQQNKYLNNEVKKSNYCDISLLKLIDEWSDIEANLYPIKNNKILKKIKYEIKKFIYSNILHKIKVNFSLFKIYYNYKYSYNLSYVNNQYLFDICSNSCDYFYEILKKYHQENDFQSGATLLEEKHGKEVDQKNENDLTCSENTCTVQKNYNKYMDELFHENDSINNNEEKCLILTQLYTSIVYYFILLIKNKYYLDFICLYMYIKFYFSLNRLFIKRNICLNFTCHKTFLDLLFLLSDISIYNNFDDENNGKKENEWEKKYTNKLGDFYNFDKFDENINIGNLTNLSFNLLLNLRVNINFYETNYDIDQNKYKYICKYLLIFQNELIQKYVIKINELTSLTLKYKQHISKKNKQTKQDSNSGYTHLSNPSESYIQDSLTDYLSVHCTDQPNHILNPRQQNYGEINGFSSTHANSPHPYDAYENFSNKNSLLKNYIFQKSSNIFNIGNAGNAGNDMGMENLSMLYEDNNLSSYNNKFLSTNPMIMQFDNHTNVKNSYFENQFVFICLNNKTYRIQIEKLIPNFFHKKTILNLGSEYIYNDQADIDLLNFFSPSNNQPNIILKRNTKCMIKYFDQPNYNDVNKNRTDHFDNEECNSFLWGKSYANDTLILKILERKIINEKNEQSEKYKNNYLNIINSIYVTLHKNVICSIDHRIEEYRYIIFKKFFIFFANHFQKNNENWKSYTLECLVGYENEMFIANKKERKIVGTDINYNKFCEKKIKNGSIYISKNIICVDYNIAFWEKQKNKKYFDLHFKPFQNIFSSPFYQKYFHIFLYFSKIGSLVRYIKTFVKVFLKLIYKKEKDYTSKNAHTTKKFHILDERTNAHATKKYHILDERTNAHTTRKYHILDERTNAHFNGIIPFGDIFISFVNSVNKYILKYEKVIRKIILYADLKTPLDIYNKIKQHTECITFLSFLCSCYTYKADIFNKNPFSFYQNCNLNKENAKFVTEYNYVSNVIYGLTHKTKLNESKRLALNNNKDNANHKFETKNNCLFIFPRGNELISYVYSFYYLFINTNNKNLKKLCKYIFLKIIKPFLHFLYSYVFMGINKDCYFEYILNEKMNMQFFFIHTDRQIIFNKPNLKSNQTLSLPIFLKYAIQIVYETASLSKFLRRSSENDFYLSLPNFPPKKPFQNDKKNKKTNKSKRTNKVEDFCIKNETEIAKFLCSASINKIKNFLNFYDKYKKIKKKKKKKKTQNIFIKCWNNEKYLNYVHKKTRKTVGNKLRNYFDTFCLFLLNVNDNTINHESFIKGKGFTKNKRHSTTSHEGKQTQIMYNHFGNFRKLKKIKNNFKYSMNRYTKIATMKSSPKIRSLVSINKRKKKKKKKKIIFYKKKINRLAKQNKTHYDTDALSTSLSSSDDEIEQADNMYNNLNIDSKTDPLLSKNMAMQIQRNAQTQEQKEIDSQNGYNINKKNENIELIDLFKFKTHTEYDPSNDILWQKNNLIKFKINYKEETQIKNDVKPCQPIHDKSIKTTYINEKNVEVKSVNYFLYRNIFIPINNHFYTINKILVHSYLINKNLLAYLCLLKCLLFDECEDNYNFLSSIMINKNNNLTKFQNINLNNFEIEDSCENKIKIYKTNNTYHSRKLSNSISNKNKILIEHKFNTNFYKANLITNKFFNININLHIPSILKIFFDNDVVNYYKNIYCLVSLFYFTINNLKDIFFIIRLFSKPVIYKYAEKVPDELHTTSDENGIEKKSEKKNEKNIFSNASFKYMNIIKKIANKHKDYTDENEDIENFFCVISKKSSHTFLTNHKILNVGFDKKFLNNNNNKIIKYLENVKIFNEILNDFNKIRSEMLLIITYLYDYIININIYKNYFLCFQNMLKTDQFIQLIYIHKYFLQYIFKFSFLASNFFFFSKIIFNIINTIDQFKKLVTSLQPLDNLNSDQDQTFSLIFDKHHKIVEENIILLTSEEAQKIIKNFYINRNNLVTHITKFQNNNLDYIYNKFYFNDYYSSLFDQS